MDARTLIGVLDESLDDIQANLSPVEWEAFSRALTDLAPRFAGVRDEAGLEDAADALYEACRPYAYLRGLLQGAITIGERKPKPPGTQADQVPLEEVINRYQNFVQRLEAAGAGERETATPSQREEEGDDAPRE